jgi:dihydroorotate dehydrogenase electron transfer subunit
MIVQRRVKLIKNIEIILDYYKMILYAPDIAKLAMPGQFVNIHLSNKYEPFLRRPFSIHKVLDSKIEILYKLVGVGTKILSRKRSGDYLDIIGPLGNGFSLSSAVYSLLVAGGIGVAPLIFLAEKLAELRAQNSKVKILVLIGARTKKQILCEREFQALGCDVKIATDDGSRGFKGSVSDLLNRLLSTVDYRPSKIYACGPKQMLQEIACISKRYNVPTQVSLEEHMACGFGACLGCVIQTKNGYKRVCKDGPIFSLRDIEF